MASFGEDHGVVFFVTGAAFDKVAVGVKGFGDLAVAPADIAFVERVVENFVDSAEAPFLFAVVGGDAEGGEAAGDGACGEFFVDEPVVDQADVAGFVGALGEGADFAGGADNVVAVGAFGGEVVAFFDGGEFAALHTAGDGFVFAAGHE